ncbi:unnamed protein product [Arabidopsis halleri]
MTTPSSHVSLPTIDKVDTESSSSSDDAVGAGGSSSSSKKGNKKKGSSNKTTGKVRLTPTDPGWPKDVPDTFQTCEKDWIEEDIIFREVVDQGEFPVCWSITLTESIEAAYNVKAKKEGRQKHPNLSAQHLINNTRKIACTDGGMRRFDEVTQFLVKEGLVTEDLCEFTGSINEDGCAHPTPDAENVTKIKDLKQIKKEQINEKDLILLVDKRPVMVQMELFESLANFKGDGVYSGPTQKEIRQKAAGKKVALHALLLVGFCTIDGVHYWKVRNSFGTRWGNNGYGKIIRQCSPGNNNPSLFVKIRYPEV